MRARIREGLTIKAALLLGFGLTLGLWLLAGYDLARLMAQVEHEVGAISARYTAAQELLSHVGPEVLLVSVYARDALLDPDPATADVHKWRLESTLKTIDETLRRYVPVLDSPEERERVERLRQEIDQFGAALLQALATEPRSTEAARALLARNVPRRELVIDFTQRVRALNRASFIQQQSSIARTYRNNQRRVWERLGLSLAGSFGIAVLAIFYVTRLETHLQAQRLRDAQHARELQRLSAQVLHVQEEERRTIARELHDEVGQTLLAVKVELAIAQRKIEAAGLREGVLDDVQSLTDGAMQTLRNVSHLLHPVVLDDLGLAAAIDWLFQGFGKRHGIRVELHYELPNQQRLPAEVETSVYRIVQEALTNIAKHAHATACRLSLSKVGDDLEITIEDNGKGFNTAAPGGAGLGLIGIRERTAQLNGRLSITSSPATGTKVRATIPIGADRQEALRQENQLGVELVDRPH